MNTVTLMGNDGEAVTFCSCCMEIGLESRFCFICSTGSGGGPSSHRLLKIRKSCPTLLVQSQMKLPCRAFNVTSKAEDLSMAEIPGSVDRI